jgi:hypothetical protein
MAGLNQLMGCLVFEITIFDCICLHVHVEPFLHYSYPGYETVVG